MAREARWIAQTTNDEIFPGLSKLRSVALASGEAFVACIKERERIRLLTDCETVDMNSFGLVQVCQRAARHLIILRVISDKAGEDAGVEFSSFAKHYKGELGKMVRGWIERMPTLPEEPEAYEEINKVLHPEQ